MGRLEILRPCREAEICYIWRDYVIQVVKHYAAGTMPMWDRRMKVTGAVLRDRKNITALSGSVPLAKTVHSSTIILKYDFF